MTNVGLMRVLKEIMCGTILTIMQMIRVGLAVEWPCVVQGSIRKLRKWLKLGSVEMPNSFITSKL